MLIVDWSSDVCSSDLTRECFSRSPHQTLTWQCSPDLRIAAMKKTHHALNNTSYMHSHSIHAFSNAFECTCRMPPADSIADAWRYCGNNHNHTELTQSKDRKNSQ